MATTLRIKLLAWPKAGETLLEITLDDAVDHPTNQPAQKAMHAAAELLAGLPPEFANYGLLYPSGSHIVVRMDGTGDKWFVSDDGYGHLEAEMMGGLSAFRRLARPLADRAGVQFDDRGFFVLEVERDELPGAVITISNVSKQAVERTAFFIETRRIAISRDVFEQRLAAAFGTRSIAHHIPIVGASGKEWDVDVGITSDSQFDACLNLSHHARHQLLLR